MTGASASTCAVSIIIVNHNSGDYLPGCLDSLRAQAFQDFEIIIIDNASVDDSMSCLDRYPEVRVIYNDTNKGFAAGQNQGIALARGEFILALNCDLRMTPAFLQNLVRALESDLAAGWACGKLLNMTPEGVPVDTLYAVGQTLPDSHFPLLRGNGERDEGQYELMEYVFGAPGAAALYRRDFVEDIAFREQFFDEAFFTWYEDVDVDWRGQLHGWRCLYVPDAVACHAGHVGETYPPAYRAWRATMCIRNRWFTIATNASMSHILRHAPPLVKHELSTIVYVIRSGLLGAYLRALKQFLQSVDYLRTKRRHVQRTSTMPVDTA